MKKGDRIRCVDAKEMGIPIQEGEVYTVKRYAKHGGTAFGNYGGDCPIEERMGLPGVELEELPSNYFMARRFEPE